MTTEEISNILLMRNERFRQQVEQEQIKAGKDINKLINTNQVHNTCQQLSKCVLPINSIHPLSLPRCQNIINREYLIIEQTLQENQIISEANLGNNKYRNGDTKDADFDIMHDIAQVGTILFESFKPQPELIFYKMPNFDNSKKSQS
ncbi:MAG: hypothetical protein Q4B28_00190 [bacterium]|nr:hypothetical protein [bacterium]